MRIQKSKLVFVVVLLASFSPSVSIAMDLHHYDLHSLVYMSTDIVIANLSQQADHTLVATVTQTLYGSLHRGQQLDKLSPFLIFFAPMEDGMQVILFLDRRPHAYDFFHSEAAKSGFAIPPSGVYLVDAYEHVHEYYQLDNPGPYVAQGYAFYFEKHTPTREQDLALPSLEEVRSRIRAAIKAVEPRRPLLDRVAVPEDAPALLDLADTTSQTRQDCALRMAEAVRERAIVQIGSLHDPELLLKAYALAGAVLPLNYEFEFIESGASTPHKQQARVRYLIETLSDKKQDAALRVVAVKILLSLSKVHSGPQNGPSKVLPIDSYLLASSATRIESTSKAIFDDDSQDPRLRELCLQFLSLDRPETIADIKRVYARTRSKSLRFAIEKSFLLESDALYQSLNPPGGPITGVVTSVPQSGCARRSTGGIAFQLDYQEQRKSEPNTGRRPVMTNLLTGQRYIENIRTFDEWGNSLREGHLEFEFNAISDFPAGNYSLVMETMRGDEVLSTSYELKLAVRETHAGKELLVSKSTEK